jgi:hypothetical protein
VERGVKVWSFQLNDDSDGIGGKAGRSTGVTIQKRNDD